MHSTTKPSRKLANNIPQLTRNSMTSVLSTFGHEGKELLLQQPMKQFYLGKQQPTAKGSGHENPPGHLITLSRTNSHQLSPSKAGKMEASSWVSASKHTLALFLISCDDCCLSPLPELWGKCKWQPAFNNLNFIILVHSWGRFTSKLPFMEVFGRVMSLWFAWKRWLVCRVFVLLWEKGTHVPTMAIMLGCSYIYGKPKTVSYLELALANLIFLQNNGQLNCLSSMWPIHLTFQNRFFSSLGGCPQS